PGIFIVLSGFATTDLSVRYCDACQGGGAYGKTARWAVAFSRLSACSYSVILPFLSPPLAAVLTSVVCQREEAEVHLTLICRTVIAGLLLTMQDRQSVPV
ncbi:hypothetical protein, partial [Serratia marcescens]|uniref:hypothetical protein n=1 Tax=Serratia marcescens TaxID=615 RepID=UPI003EC57FF9